MKKDKQLKDQDRREFIKKSTLIGAGVAASSLATTQVIADSGETIEPTESKGYRVTQHVLDYYKSAGI